MNKIQTCPKLLSVVFNILDLHLIDLAHGIVDKFICSPINSDCGLHIVVERAMNNLPSLNINRPAVIRQYFGLTVNDSTKRYTYPKVTSVGGVSLGTDPNNFITRPMNKDMYNIGNKLRQLLISNRSILNLEEVNLDNHFNHMTLLTYYSSSDSNRKSSMGYHSDMFYNLKDGLYDARRNSQVQNTVTVVLSIGDNRTLKWKRRFIGNRKGISKAGVVTNRRVWVDDDTFNTCFELGNSTVTIINPLDEDPLYNTEGSVKTQYLHGGVNVSGDKLAFGFVYRFVMGQASYSDITHRMLTTDAVPNDDYNKLYNKVVQENFMNNLRTSYINKFY